MDRFVAAPDPVTGLLPLHVETAEQGLRATDSIASGLDMGRLTAGLVMASRLALAVGDWGRSDRYLAAAETNYARGRELLGQGDFFVQRRDFNPDGSVRWTEVGEPTRAPPEKTT